jgi:hypothetical protein
LVVEEHDEAGQLATVLSVRVLNVLDARSSLDRFPPLLIASFRPTVFKRTPQYSTMSTKINLSHGIDGLGVLQSVAKAVPVLGAPVEGSIEALKQILQYTQVGRLRGSVAHCRGLIAVYSK